MRRLSVLLVVGLLLGLVGTATATDPLVECRYRTDPTGTVTIARWDSIRTAPNSLSVWLTGSCQQDGQPVLVELRVSPADIERLYDMLAPLLPIVPYPE